MSLEIDALFSIPGRTLAPPIRVAALIVASTIFTKHSTEKLPEVLMTAINRVMGVCTLPHIVSVKYGIFFISDAEQKNEWKIGLWIP